MVRPSSKTGLRAIERIERACAVLRMKSEGYTLKQIGMMQTPPVTAQAIHRLYWRTIKANPPSRRRQLAARERAVLLSDPA